ncbi:HIP116 protein [Cynara cardunculus var. scolymus]|uniref:Fanconi-associated nuclease n=1 Tax=Cynara cardunculus var. scolymus TaxID=59895 RepID=A0A124SEJ9_CYNCS|nr:HIP116 protein [Cynara cardunculus var. scolymus]
MLTGRESLIRLIGKRRRFLPNRQSIMSAHIQRDSSLVKDENGAEESLEERSENLAGTSGSDMVTCPVCGNKVRGEEYMINSHLDACLARGTKRKLSQQTLLQFNFCSKSKVQFHSTNLDDTKSNLTSLEKDITDLGGVGTEDTDSITCQSSSSSDDILLANADDSAEISVNDEKIGVRGGSPVNNGGRVNSPSLLTETEVSEDDSANSDDDILGKLLATFIVGRRFSEEGELHTGASISLCRDPENIKDPNAVKMTTVLQMLKNHMAFDPESGCSKVLGYIPRELAEHLSKLMDTFGLSFEGRIMSVPEHAHAVVPIQIWCQEKISSIELEGENFQVFKSLCRHILSAVKLSEASPPVTMKYQQNFCLLLQEVLRTTLHVFTHDEKIFLENFLLLSDDSQRLFIRLYTRKGPWFRMSNIAYVEILDSQHAVKKLSGNLILFTKYLQFITFAYILKAIIPIYTTLMRLCIAEAGYVCSIETTSELHKDDLEGVLNILTVGLFHVYNSIHSITTGMNPIRNTNHKRKRLLNRSQEYQLQCLLSKEEFFQNAVIASRNTFLHFFLHMWMDQGLAISQNHVCCSSLLKKAVLEKAGSCIRISSAADSLIWRVERLFFCNGEQDLSAFLLVDLGIVKYPTYNCVVTDQIFSSRNDLLSYEEALEVAQIMDESLEENDSSMVLRCIAISDSSISNSAARTIQLSTSKQLPAPFPCFSAFWIYSKVVLLGVSFLECQRRYDDAINLLEHLLLNFANDRRRGYWTLRLSINLEHLGRVNESLCVAETGLLDPWVRAGSRISLQRRVLRLGRPPRRWKVPSYSESLKRKIPEFLDVKLLRLGDLSFQFLLFILHLTRRICQLSFRPLNCKTGTKSRFYGEDGEQCGVEQLALQYYAGEGGGWQGVHSESGIWLTVFGLLMWDVIFADMPNNSPLDLDTDHFYESRKSIIEPLLVKIEEGMGEEMLITSWESHLGTACRGVDWNRHSLTELRAIVTCIGGRCLASICRHLAQDYRSWSSGMPDLLLWRFHGDYSGEAKLVEVKGPRDRLSEQQRAWLLFLMDSGFNAEVCRVNPPVSK